MRMVRNTVFLPPHSWYSQHREDNGCLFTLPSPLHLTDLNSGGMQLGAEIFCCKSTLEDYNNTSQQLSPFFQDCCVSQGGMWYLKGTVQQPTSWQKGFCFNRMEWTPGLKRKRWNRQESKMMRGRACSHSPMDGWSYGHGAAHLHVCMASKMPPFNTKRKNGSLRVVRLIWDS